MKRFITLTLAVFLLFTASLTPILAVSNMAFADVHANNWFYPYV